MIDDSPEAVAEIAHRLALWEASFRGSGIYRHPAPRLHGETPPEYAARVGPLMRDVVAAVLDIVKRRQEVAALPPFPAPPVDVG